MKFTQKLLAITFLSVLGLFGLSHKAHAATLAVNGSCTLPEAIASVNAQADGSDGCTSTGSYGTNDTINLPSGTQTLSDDLPAFTTAVVINGSGMGSTLIDAAGFEGFRYASADSQTRNLYNFTIKKLKITGAKDYAIHLSGANVVLLDELDVADSDDAVRIGYSTDVTISKSDIHDNVSQIVGESAISGFSIELGTKNTSGVASATVTDTKIRNNTAMRAGGILISSSTVFEHDDIAVAPDYEIRRVQITGNHATDQTGLMVIQSGGPTAQQGMSLVVDATTVANNATFVTDPQHLDDNVVAASFPVMAGFLITGGLTSGHHFTNVTVANNSAINQSPDNRRTFAGFYASLANSGANMDIVNTTVVGNSVTNPEALFVAPAFFATKVALDEAFQVINLSTGSTATNVLVANNLFNGQHKSCMNSLAGSLFGYSQDVDVTPTDSGHNMSDDQSCTGYQYVPGLYDTIDHEVKDNGGPVPTIALHDNSPAVDGGGQVLGISTDARGVAREGHYSVGAYQGNVLAANTTNQSNNAQLAKTGIFVAMATPIGLFMVAAPMYLLWDYRRHKSPLLEIDPSVEYTFWHHVRMVSIPLVKYRLSFSVEKTLSNRSGKVRRF